MGRDGACSSPRPFGGSSTSLRSGALPEVFFVRHAPVALDPARPASEWQLSEEGRRLADRLGRANLWHGVRRVASSPERKAVDTAQPIAAAAGPDVEVVDDLREANRGATPVMPATRYRELVTAYLSSRPVEGWEPAGDVRARVAAAIARLRREDEGRPLVVVSHGLALSLYLDLTPAEWSAIPLPAVAVDGPPFLSLDEFLARS